MASEKFANLAETTLASGYTSGATTLSVTSAAGFPTVGVFRVRLGNVGKTIWRVDSVSGTTFTGAAEANDANANSGDSVKIVASKAVAERFTQSPESGESRLISGASAVDFFGPTHKLVALSTGSWVWINQGAATVVEAGGITLLTVPTAGGTNFRMFKKAAPATPWTITAVVIPRVFRTANQNFGLAMRESGTGQIMTIDYAGHAAVNNIEVNKLTNETTFSALAAAAGDIVASTPLHLRMADNGTNITFSYSFDGRNFVQLFQEARGTFLPPDEVGIIGAAGGTASAMSFLSWIES